MGVLGMVFCCCWFGSHTYPLGREYRSRPTADFAEPLDCNRRHGMARMMVATPSLRHWLGLRSNHLPLRFSEYCSFGCAMVTIAFLTWTGGSPSSSQSLMSLGSGFFKMLLRPCKRLWQCCFVMFASLLVLTCGTTFLGKAGADSYLANYDNLIPNPVYLRAVDARYDAQHASLMLSRELCDLERKLAAYQAAENQAVSQGRALYKATKFSPPVIVFAVCTMLSSFFGCAPTAQLDGVSSVNAGQHLALVICATSDQEIQRELLSQLDALLDWLSGQAEVGTQVYVIDASSGSEIVRFSAVAGAKRIRRNAMRQSAAVVHEWVLRKRQLRSDQLVNLPRVAQTAAQLDPAPVHVVVIGAPILVIEEGPDQDFSMANGHVPSDGMLTADSSQSIYSTLALKNRMSGQYWHFDGMVTVTVPYF